MEFKSPFQVFYNEKQLFFFFFNPKDNGRWISLITFLEILVALLNAIISSKRVVLLKADTAFHA